MNGKRKTITATEFKAKCLEILDYLGPEGLTVTKRGQPVARVIPLRRKAGKDFYGSLKGKIIAATSIVENIPLLTRDRRIRRSKMVPFAL